MTTESSTVNDQSLAAEPQDSSEAQETKTQDVSNAGSSPAEGVKTDAPKSMLEAVMQAVQPAEPAEKDDGKKVEGAAPGADEAKDGKLETKATDPKDQDAADDKLPFGKHPRFKQILSERNSFKDRAEKAEKAFNDAKPQLENLGKLQGFVRSQNLTAEDVNNGFRIMGLVRNDPVKALVEARAIVAQLEQITGEAVPDDLRSKIDAGLVDEEEAKNLSRQRAAAKLAEGRAQQTIDSARAKADADAEAQAQALDRDVRTAVTTWETAWKKNDPDFEHKHPFVMAEIQLLLASEGHAIRSKDDALALADKAKKNVESRLGLLLPKKEEKTVVKGGANAGATPRPGSLKEAIAQGAAGTYRPS